MDDLFERYEKNIQQYCLENGLDFKKAQKMGRCWGKDDLWLQYLDPEKGKKGLLEESPAPIVLIMKVTNQGVIFEQTEFTFKYLFKENM